MDLQKSTKTVLSLLWQKIYNLRIVLYASMLIIFGLILFGISFFVQTNCIKHFLEIFGHTVIIAGIVTIIFEQMVKKETLEIFSGSVTAAIQQHTEKVIGYLEENLNKVLIQTLLSETNTQLEILRSSVEKAIGQQTENVREHLKRNVEIALAEALLSNSKTQIALLNPSKLDNMIQLFIAARLIPLDGHLGNELYTGIVKPVVDHLVSGHRNMLYDYHQIVKLDKYTPTTSQQNEFFLLTITEDYKCQLRTTTCRFSCVIDLKEFNDRLNSLEELYTYYLPVEKLVKNWFEVKDFSIHGNGWEKRTFSKPEIEADDKAITYTFKDVVPEEMLAQNVHMYYQIKTVMLIKSHHFFYTPKDPTKNITVRFECIDPAIKKISTIQHLITDFIPIIKDLDENKVGKSVQIDGWVAPGSGITFVWSL